MKLPRITDAAGQTTTSTYNASGQVLTVTNPKNETTTYLYDSNGYLQAVTEHVAGATTSFTYDAYGRLHTVTDSDGYVVTTDYDSLDRVTRATYPDGTYDETAYTRLDPTARRDRLGRWSRATFDALQRVVSIRDAEGRAVTQRWCPCGSLDALIDAKGNATTWFRDAQGRVTRETRANGAFTAYAYETTTSRLKTVTDPKGQVTTYTYALDGAPLGTTYTNAQIATPSVSFTYELSYARLASMVDGTGTTAYAYHPTGSLGAGQLATVDGPLANDTIAYAYDEVGRMVQRSINGAANTLTLVYDALGRVVGEANVLGTFTYGYDGVTSRLASVVYPNGQTSTYSYLPNLQDRRLQTIHHKYPSAATLSKLDYTYDAVGNIRTWQQQADSAAPVLWTYENDRADQLVAATKQTVDPAPQVLKRYVYTYDPAGNRLSEQIDDAVTGWTYDNMNRLVTQAGGGTVRFAGAVNEAAAVTVGGKPAEVTPTNTFSAQAPVAPGTNVVTVVATDGSGNATTNRYQVEVAGTPRSFIYDADGNLASDGTRTFTWDARNRLVAVAGGTHGSEFTYDGLDQRVRAVEKNNGVTVRDAGLYWADSAMVEERLTTGEINRFVSGGEQHNGAATYSARDHLFSLREAVDSAGTLVTRNDYDPYGRLTRIGGTDDSTFGFTGHQAHAGSGLALALYRAYDASVGRWLSEDPLGFVDGPNVYAYVNQNPTSLIDPTGLFVPANHNQFTRDAMAIAGNVRCPTLPEDVALVDSEAGAQDPRNAFWHAMRNGKDPSQTAQMAQTKWKGYIGTAMGWPCDCHSLAHALHAVQDAHAGGHGGFAPWYGYRDIRTYMAAPGHVWRDSFPSGSGKAAAIADSVKLLQQFKECTCK